MDIVKAFVLAFVKAYVSTHTTRTFKKVNDRLFDVCFSIDDKFFVGFNTRHISATLFVSVGRPASYDKNQFITTRQLLCVELSKEAWYRRDMNKLNKSWLLADPTPLYISRIIDTVIS